MKIIYFERKTTPYLILSHATLIDLTNFKHKIAIISKYNSIFAMSTGNKRF